MRITTAFLVLMLLYAPSASAAVWNIEPDGTGDAPTIQAGIDLASSGDTILLGPGTYTGAGNKDVDFLEKDVVVTSSAGATATVIDCESVGRAFLCVRGETAAATISDVTIRNGNPGAVGLAAGGAVFCSGSNPTVRNCIFEDNIGGGGIGGGGGAIHYNLSPRATVEGCVFTNNVVNTVDGAGGGISLFHTDGTITNCEFVGNRTALSNASGGGGVFS
jgi:hypothetical protein